MAESPVLLVALFLLTYRIGIYGRGRHPCPDYMCGHDLNPHVFLYFIYGPRMSLAGIGRSLAHVQPHVHLDAHATF